MQLPLGASWCKLDKHNKKQIYENMQEIVFRTARNEYLSMLMENVSSLVEYRDDHDDYMFTSDELKEETLKVIFYLSVEVNVCVVVHILTTIVILI